MSRPVVDEVELQSEEVTCGPSEVDAAWQLLGM